MLSLADPSGQMRLIEAFQRHGCTVEPGGLPGGRPDRSTLALVTRAGVAVVAKIYPGTTGLQTFHNMQQLWQSSFGERRQPPGLPRPLDYLPDLGALLTERLPGRPLGEFGPAVAPVLAETMRLLAALHQCDAAPERRRTWRGIVRSLERKADKISRLAPEYGQLVSPVVAALAAAGVKDSELVPSHGDFSPRNVLVGPDRMALIDWDRFQWADPARDVAYFGISNWRADLRRNATPDRSRLDRSAEAYEASRPGVEIRDQLRFHIAAGLVRMACGLVELWPREAALVPGLMRLAARELEG